MPEILLPRLLVDASLGHVARDLRLLGYDAAFAGGRMPNTVLRTCQAEARILVTRNSHLHRRALGLRSIRVRSTVPLHQTLEVLRTLAPLPRPNPRQPRCLACNELLRPLPERLARPRVPDHVAHGRHAFVECPACGRVYWPGSHAAPLRQRRALLRHALQVPRHRV